MLKPGERTGAAGVEVLFSLSPPTLGAGGGKGLLLPPLKISLGLLSELVLTDFLKPLLRTRGGRRAASGRRTPERERRDRGRPDL